jgi:hypothetical protein
MYNPSKDATQNKSDVIRILGISTIDGTPVSEYVYLLENNTTSTHSLGRVDKIGDAVYKGNGVFLIIERDSSNPNETKNGKKAIFEIDIKGATNILELPISSKMISTDASDKTLEMMSADDLVANDIQAVYKHKVVNLPSLGWKGSDKAEEIVILPNGDLAVINDNDFGLAGAGVTDNIELGIISFANNYGFDASDKSETVEIVARPTYGLPMPDAISSYQVNGTTYFVTANEGDGRVRPDGDYTHPVSGDITDEGDVYEDEKKVSKWTLDPTIFPNASDLQDDENLGRLKTISQPSIWIDPDKDGDADRLFSFGTRSFSIYDEYGNLVFDSGNDFEVLSYQLYPTLFNSKNGDIDKFKDRSDAKGPEPEGIVLGDFDGKKYAFVGIERTGGVFVYDITNPFKSTFVQYINTALTEGDVAPEGLTFVNAEDSPNGGALLFVANELSGSVAVFEFGTGIQTETAISSSQELPELIAFPTITTGKVNFIEANSGNIFSITGIQVASFKDTKNINLEKQAKGMYIIVTEDGLSTKIQKI